MNATRYPYWIFLGALIIGAGYLPTLLTPFDFVDDGNLVYPAPAGTTFAGHVSLWWEKVQANYEHLGPFRPVLWVHWELFANATGGDAFRWRCIRLAFCVLSTGMLLWFFREMRLHPVAALVTAAVAMWNPFRGEIWTSLTLAEGVAMPYALLALIASRRAAYSAKPWRWELLAILGILAALGCKNTYTALFPVMVCLRLFPENLSLRDGWTANRWRAILLLLPMILPAIHFVYFKLNWHPGQYKTDGVSWAQLGRILSAYKGAMGLDFLGGPLAILLFVLWKFRREPAPANTHGFAIAALLSVCGILVYLPMSMMSGRYTMPGIWGLDLLLGLLLTRLMMLPPSAWKRVAWAALWIGMLVVATANMFRQDKFAARARVLWDAVKYLEAHAEPNAKIAWISGDSAAGELNIEEGIHVRWHLLNRGRPDIQVGLFDRDGKLLDRVELPKFDGEPSLRIWGRTTTVVAGTAEQSFQESYQIGRKFYECHIGR